MWGAPCDFYVIWWPSFLILPNPSKTLKFDGCYNDKRFVYKLSWENGGDNGFLFLKRWNQFQLQDTLGTESETLHLYN
jgi:hypothetical protein